MAEGIFRKIIDDRKLDWKVESAGVWAQGGDEPAENAILILLEKGINIRSHRSKPVNLELVNRHDLILVMEKNHKEALELTFPDAKDKLFLISRLIDENFDIADPIGHSLQDFRETAKELEDILSDGVEKVEILLKR
jgi:protein-tyrosine-phosphatase